MSHEKRFIIVTPGRSGSYFIVETLNNHPDVICLGEVFNRSSVEKSSFNYFIRRRLTFKIFAFVANREKLSRWRINIVLSLLVRLFINQLYKKEQKLCGFKLSLDQMHAYPQVLRYARHLGYRVIYLTRKDKLKLVLSLIKSRQTKSYRASIGGKFSFLLSEVERVYLDILSWEKKLLASFPDLVVQYEDLFNDLPDSLDPLASFLGITFSQRHLSNMAKVHTDQLEEWVENIDEIRELYNSIKS